MLRLVWTQLRRRGGRTVALTLAILVAAAGFTVLTASSTANRLQAVGTVQAHARTAYDILVRPTGARSGLEQSKDLVQPGFLSGIYGGISLAQWQQIKRLPGIDIAAPIAMVGYVAPQVDVPVDLSGALPKAGDGVARVDVWWSMDNGLSGERQAPDFTYVTSDALALNQNNSVAVIRKGDYVVAMPSGTPRYVCPSEAAEAGMSLQTRMPRMACWSRTSGGEGERDNVIANKAVQAEQFALPFVLAAVDPAEEAKLTGLDQAVVSGSSLTGAPLTDPRAYTTHAIPVLVANTVATQATATISVSAVDAAGARAAAAGAGGKQLSAAPARLVRRQTVTSAQAYESLLTRLAKPQHTMRFLGNVETYWTVSSPAYQVGPNGALSASKEPNKVLQGLYPDDVPPGADDTAVRAATKHQLYNELIDVFEPGPTLTLRGTFDTSRLKGTSDLTAQILGGLSDVPVPGADARSKGLLGDQPLPPSPNIAGLVQPPPLMITTLGALPWLTRGGWDPNDAPAPISAIRVRVAGVTGVDALSRERVRVAAQRITEATGLDVDITVGSSTTRETISLPAGTLGRPQLLLSQWWVKKGVATAILEALDRKSLIIFFLVLLVCALSVANSAVASVRSRRTELGVLACLGWRRRHLFVVVLAELTAVALAAGLAAGVLSLGAGALLDVSVSWRRALLAIPAALLVALLAGLVPAWLAARADPMEAVRPAVHPPRRARAPRTVTGLGLVNLGRTRARAVIAAGGLAVAVATFTLLLAITLAFQGTVVGTILGDAVAVQVRGADYAATAATLLLAALGVANVLYLNIRDRGPEIATLRAVGWRESHLARLTVVEGLGIGVLGALPGAAAGLAGAVVLANGITPRIGLAAALAALTGLGIAALASTIPVRMLRRLPTAVLLTEE